MSKAKRRGVHRRAFLTLSAAAAVAAPSAADEPGKPPALSPTAEAQLQAILAKHGTKMTREQKEDLKKLMASIRKTSETLHTFPLPENSEPALAFRVYRADRR